MVGKRSAAYITSKESQGNSSRIFGLKAIEEGAYSGLPVKVSET